jgi:hypothetical protein
MQIARSRLRTQTGFNSDGGAPFSGSRNAAAPFALAPVEQQNRIALSQPQYIQEIIRLVATEHGIGAGAQRRVDEKPGHAKFVAGHGVNCRKTWLGFTRSGKARRDSTGSFRRLPDAFGLL